MPVGRYQEGANKVNGETSFSSYLNVRMCARGASLSLVFFVERSETERETMQKRVGVVCVCVRARVSVGERRGFFFFFFFAIPFSSLLLL